MSNMSYASVIGRLMYAMLCTKLDIVYVTSVTSTYKTNPRRNIGQL